MGDDYNVLPPGFRFEPTDEELIVHFLHRKASLLPFNPDLIPDLHLYSYDPWELDGKALREGNKWYFYSRKSENWNTSNGYWKAMGIEEAVFTSAGNEIGMKKNLVFYMGEAPDDGVQTNWIMHQYRLSDSLNSSSRSSRTRRRPPTTIDYSKWVVCRVYEGKSDDGDDDEPELSSLDEVFLTLDDLDEISLPN